MRWQLLLTPVFQVQPLKQGHLLSFEVLLCNLSNLPVPIWAFRKSLIKSTSPV